MATSTGLFKYGFKGGISDGGQDNTASNVGTGGVGIYKQKTGVDLEFKKLNGTTSEIEIADDTGNSEVDISLADNVILPGTDSVRIPGGTTAQRNGTPVEGMLRKNTSDNVVEYYDGSGWVQLGAGGGGGGGRVFLGSATASSSATLDLTSLMSTTYTRYILEVENLKSATSGSNVTLLLRFSQDNGSTWDAGSGYTYNGRSIAGATEATYDGAASGNISLLSGTHSSEGVHSVVQISGTEVGSQTRVFCNSTTDKAATSATFTFWGSGASNANQLTNALRVYFSTGNIASGTVYLYGIVNS